MGKRLIAGGVSAGMMFLICAVVDTPKEFAWPFIYTAMLIAIWGIHE